MNINLLFGLYWILCRQFLGFLWDGFFKNTQPLLGLNRNFFAALTAQLPPEFTTNAPDPALPLQERIVVLEVENKLLNAKLETLMTVVRK